MHTNSRLFAFYIDLHHIPHQTGHSGSYTHTKNSRRQGKSHILFIRKIMSYYRNHCKKGTYPKADKRIFEHFLLQSGHCPGLRLTAVGTLIAKFCGKYLRLRIFVRVLHLLDKILMGPLTQFILSVLTQCLEITVIGSFRSHKYCLQ